MNDQGWPHDDLIARIAEAFDDLPPVPERLSRVAHDAFAWRRTDAELAELLSDSSEHEPVGVRGSSTDRRAFRYRAGDVVIRVHLADETLMVMLEPSLSVECRVATADGSTEHRTDELGELAVDLPDLPVRIEVDLPTGTVVTPWITA